MAEQLFPGPKPLLDTPDNINKPIPKPPGVIRIWVDGCFDMMHFGHANAIRQAAMLGHELYVGIHTDEEVERFKGPPIMQDHERYAAARACKWVSRVIEGVPYVTQVEDIEKYEIDYVVHGDDVSTDLHGNNSYQAIIDLGKFKLVKRTDGISTTDLVGRMLLVTRQHHQHETEDNQSDLDGPKADLAKQDPSVTYGRYLTTSRKIVQFSNNTTPKDGDRIVYVDGGFDCFHAGHAALLKKAKEEGDYLIVGLHTDDALNKLCGANFPIMNMNERTLGVLSCRYVDEVIMGVPHQVTKKLIEQLNISVVIHGKVSDTLKRTEYDPYEIAKEMGIYKEVDSGSTLVTRDVIQRVIEHRMAFEERQKKKLVKDKMVEESKPEENRKIREI